jgi:hypothetical protein
MEQEITTPKERILKQCHMKKAFLATALDRLVRNC